MQKPRLSCLLIFAAAVVAASPGFAQTAQSGIALHGDPKYPPAFTHFDYTDPEAPKGGTLHLAALGTFDTVNPFTLKGVVAEGAPLVFETLMAQPMDEAFSEYGWLAETITVAPDRSWVAFKLRPQARFSDGQPVTPADVIFSFETLRDKGHPFYRSYYKDVAKAEQTGSDSVKFTLRDMTNTELPLIMGQLPVFEKKSWAGKDFAATTLDPIIGSGPYKIESLTPGRTITLARDPNWWGKDLPVNKGRYNFDRLSYDYYRDSTVETEAFFAGRYDFRQENIAKNWALSYNTPAVTQGLIRQQELKNELPTGMQGYLFNIRKPVFQDRRVRAAIGYAFDFEWSNKQFAYGSYKRSTSYFSNSELAATGVPQDEELKLLEPFRAQLPPELFTEPFTLPTTNGSGDNRMNLRKAADLLKQAGWTLKDGNLVDAAGQPLTFEIIATEPMFDRWTQPFLRNLERLGIHANLRMVDVAQYQSRMDDFDYDMTIGVFPASLSPGNEQYDTWSGAKAEVKGSRNLAGAHDPVVDALLDKVIHAGSREQLVTATHALDRVLLWNYYVVPHWYLGSYRIAFWDKFGQPKLAPKYGLAVIDSWWVDPAKAGKIDTVQKRD